jgi:5-methylcytosine-specific restriction endonuclease McrA
MRTNKLHRIRIRRTFNMWKQTADFRTWFNQQYRSQDGRCFYCLIPLDLLHRRSYQIDHRVPIYRGGTNSPDNLCIACTSCNQVKGAERLPSYDPDLLAAQAALLDAYAAEMTAELDDRLAYLLAA